MAVIRHGALRKLFAGTYAPSTLGSLLRAFLFGHVRQLDAAASGWLGNLAASRAGITRAGALRGPPDRPVMAVPTAPEQIIDNFVDNALSASPDGATITVRIVRAGPDTILHVLDDGPGFSEDERNRAFDRFWRTTSNKEGNGLAIVAQLALASGAEARLAPRPQGGLDASVRFATAR